MGEVISTLANYSENLSESLKKIKTSLGTKPVSNEITELLAISSTLNPETKTAELQRASIDVASYYDIFTKTRELSESAFVKDNIDELKKIETETNQIIEKTAEVMTPRQANNRLLSYSNNISELSIISESVKEIITEINDADNWKDDKFNEVKIVKQKSILDVIKEKITGVINGMKAILDSAKNALMSALTNLVNAVKKLGKSTFSKFMKALNFFIEKLNGIKLKLVEGMLGFVDQVVKLAKKKNWVVSQINMTMPEISVNFAEVNIPFIGKVIKIPLPDITQPKVTVTFTLPQ